MDETSSLPGKRAHGASAAEACLFRQWNSKYISTERSCVHDLVSNMAKRQPFAEAVCSWDGSLTYQRLNYMADVCACHLIELGVSPGSFVPFAFEKSYWAVVATLSIMKAGAAFVPVDVDGPLELSNRVCSTVGATLVVVSEQSADKMAGLNKSMVVISPTTFRSYSERYDDRAIENYTTPLMPALLLFTSGSTGKPKGVVQSHQSVCSNAMSHGEALDYRARRVLNFAAHTWDVTVMDFFTTLIFGGCICIPSDSQRRSNIAAAMTWLRVDHALLTPSLASVLQPDEVPHLRVLILGGEPWTMALVDRWAHRVKMFNCFGRSFMQKYQLEDHSIDNAIGAAEFGSTHGMRFMPQQTTERLVGNLFPRSVAWLVDPMDHNRLVRLGETGELIVAGPTLADGYINDNYLTKLSFVSEVTWAASQGHPGARFYKTGDMLKYSTSKLDGSLEYIGRKDSQFKVFGQKVDPVEAQRQLSTIPNVLLSAVVFPTSGTFQDRLVGILQFSTPVDSVITADPVDRLHLLDAAPYLSHLAERLPRHMIPSFFLSIQSMPLTASHKVDRRALQALLNATQVSHLADLLLEASKDQVLRPSEQVANAITLDIANAMSVNQPELALLIGRNFHLSTVGMDSLSMIKVAAAIWKRHRVQLPLTLLLNQSVTVRQIAAAVQSDNLSWHPQDLTAAEIASEVVEMQQLYPLTRKPFISHGLHSSDMRSAVFLTGATGLLGSELLTRLLKGSQHHVIALVKASSLEKFWKRVRVLSSGLKESFKSRFEVWVGDLSEPDLGLKDFHLKRLLGESERGPPVTSIIHAGARVHWLEPYEALKAVNVASVSQLLAIASASETIRSFHFVSGGMSLETNTTNLCLCTTEDLIAQAIPGTAYSRSKLISELMVKESANKCLNMGLSFRVWRPGYLIPAAQALQSVFGDYVWRLIEACISLGVYSQEDAQGWLYISGADTVATRICAEIDHGDEIEPTGRLTCILDGILLHDLWSELESFLGRKLMGLPHGEWYSRLQHAIEVEGIDHPLFPLAHIVQQGAGRITSTRMPDTKEPSKPGMAALRWNLKRLVQGLDKS